MPYRVTDKLTGKVATFENQPTDEDIQEAFGTTPQSTQQQPTARGNIIDAVSSPLFPLNQVIGKTKGAFQNLGKNLEQQNKQITPENPKIATQAALESALSFAPLSMAAKGAPSFLETLIPKELPEKFYASAAKFSTALKPEERIGQIQTGIREKITPTFKGYQKLKGIVDDINGQVKNIIDDSGIGKEVDPNKVVQRLNDLRKFYGNSTDPAPYMKVIDNAEEAFLKAHGQTAIPMAKAQLIKQTEGAIIRKSYGELAAAEIEAKKGLVRGLKEEIYAQFPELQSLNARESSLLALEDAIEKAAGRIQNWNILGLGKPMSTTAGGALGGRGGAVVGLLASAIDQPYLKSKLAMALDSARKIQFKNADPMKRILLLQAMKLNKSNMEE